MSRWRRQLHRRHRKAEARRRSPLFAVATRPSHEVCTCAHRWQKRERREVRVVDARCPVHGHRGHLRVAGRKK